MNKKIIFIIMMAAIYAAGIISGVFVGRHFAMKKGFLHHARKMPTTERVVDRFAKKLDLTDEQKKKVSMVLENNKAEADKYLKEFDVNMKRTMDSINESIKVILTEEQKTKYDKLIKEMPARMRSREGRGKMGPPLACDGPECPPEMGPPSGKPFPQERR